MLVQILAIHALVDIPAPEEHCPAGACKGPTRPMLAAHASHVTREVIVHMTEWKNLYHVTADGSQVLLEKPHAKNALKGIIVIAQPR